MPDKRRWRRREVWAIVLSINSLLLLLLVLFFTLIYSNPTFDISAEPAITLVSVVLLIAVVWSLISWRAVTGSLFNPYAMFLIAAALFNGGQVFLDILHLGEHSVSSYSQWGDPLNVRDKFSSATYLQTVFLVTLGYIAFHTGGLLSVPSYSLAAPREVATSTLFLTARALRLVGWGLLAVSFIPFLVLVKIALTLVATGGYATYLRDFGESIPGVIRILAFFIVPSCLFLLAGSKNMRTNIIISVVVVLIYSSTLYFVGNRQAPAMLIVSFAWVYDRCIRPLPRLPLVLGGGFMLFVLFPLIAQLRGVGGEKRFSLDTLSHTLLSTDNPIVASISEIGYSMMTVAYTISLVPSYRPFDMGGTYLYSFLSLIPKLFSDTVIAHAALDDWLIQAVAPSLSYLGAFSYGYSFIAEAYINFGWLGAPFALGVMGYLFGKFVVWADKSADPARIAMVGAFTSFFLIYARGEALEIVRPIAYYAFIPYLAVYGLRMMLSKHSEGMKPYR
jgi:oligosaccharide repeat unit polymerase